MQKVKAGSFNKKTILAQIVEKLKAGPNRTVSEDTVHHHFGGKTWGTFFMLGGWSKC